MHKMTTNVDVIDRGLLDSVRYVHYERHSTTNDIEIEVIRKMITFIFGLLFLFLSLYLYLTWNFDHWKRRGVYGPRPRPYVGTFPKTALLDKSSNYISETSEIYRKHFRKHRFIGVFEYREPKLMILDPALVADIYVKYFRNFLDNTIGETVYLETDPLFKLNPFITTGAEWKERRAELAPAFTMLKVKNMYPVIEDACQQLVNYINNGFTSGQATFASKDIASRVTAASLCTNMFGLDAHAFDDHSDFVYHSLRMFHPLSTVRSIFWSLFPILNELLPNRHFSEEFNVWFQSLYKQAVRMRQENNIEKDDFLNFLMELEKKRSFSIVMAAAFTFFLDGFETTSYMLGSAINELARDKECQEKLREEVKTFKDKDIGFDELNQMPYLDAVVNETTRLSPFPFPIWKTCTEDIELTDFDGRVLKIDKGTKIILPTTALHNHPDYWDESKKFNPSRFNGSSGDAKTLKDAGVFTPFGNGPRICMGMRWAVTVIKAVLCGLVDNFEFSVKFTPNKPSPKVGSQFFSDNPVELEFERLK